MADEGDLATQEIENSLHIATQQLYSNAVQKTDKSGVVICKECDESIPPERAAIFGVTRCFHCQAPYS